MRYPFSLHTTCCASGKTHILFADDLRLTDHRPWCEKLSDYNDEIEPDHLRVYVPMDLSKQLILDRLDYIIFSYGEANEYNEHAFAQDVNLLLLRVKLYDQIRRERHGLISETRSPEAISLIQDFVKRLENIPDGCAEVFPFEMIEDLREEYLIK